MKTLKMLYRIKNEATRDFNEALESMFPVGTVVEYNILDTQEVPNTGVVVGYMDHSCLRIKNDQSILGFGVVYNVVFFGDVTKQGRL